MSNQINPSFEVKSIQKHKRIIFPRTYIQGKDIINNLVEILELQNKNILYDSN
jgi:hypothetical protein